MILIYRRFSLGHLAQLKFILPEVIQIKKVLTFDEKTSCMKPDLHVTVNADAIECDGKSKCNSKNLNLRTVFRARLMDFLKDHPEVYDSFVYLFCISIIVQFPILPLIICFSRSLC